VAQRAQVAIHEPDVLVPADGDEHVPQAVVTDHADAAAVAA
jgi:hypothetical protein